MFKGPFRAILVKEPKGQTGGMSYHSQSQPSRRSKNLGFKTETHLSGPDFRPTPSGPEPQVAPTRVTPVAILGHRAPGSGAGSEPQGTVRPRARQGDLVCPKNSVLQSPTVPGFGFGERKDFLRKPWGIVQGVKHLLASVTQVSG